MAKKSIGVNFPAGTEHLKDEVQKRADAMGISDSKYVLMLIIRHVKSGEAFTISDGAGKAKKK